MKRHEFFVFFSTPCCRGWRCVCVLGDTLHNWSSVVTQRSLPTASEPTHGFAQLSSNIIARRATRSQFYGYRELSRFLREFISTKNTFRVGNVHFLRDCRSGKIGFYLTIVSRSGPDKLICSGSKSNDALNEKWALQQVTGWGQNMSSIFNESCAIVRQGKNDSVLMSNGKTFDCGSFGLRFFSLHVSSRHNNPLQTLLCLWQLPLHSRNLPWQIDHNKN